ncbi:unnamed protein product [Victoria cruziana]
MFDLYWQHGKIQPLVLGLGVSERIAADWIEVSETCKDFLISSLLMKEVWDAFVCSMSPEAVPLACYLCVLVEQLYRERWPQPDFVFMALWTSIDESSELKIIRLIEIVGSPCKQVIRSAQFGVHEWNCKKDSVLNNTKMHGL